MKTQASWKNGLFDVPVVDSNSECVGEEPTSSPKEGSYWRRLNWSAASDEALDDSHQSWSGVKAGD